MAIITESNETRSFPRVCHWKQDEEGHWFGTCGIGWTLNDEYSTPKEHQMNFCPKCGAMLLQHPYEEQED